VIDRVQSYDPKQHDIAAALDAVLAAGAGQKSGQAVFLSVNPEVAHELATQLKYHQNSDLAVYAMPNIYRGRQSPEQDAELGKITFCDIPWLFADAYTGALSQQALKNVWQSMADSQLRLLALGVDAYNLLGQLNQLSSGGYAGATGRLALNAENRVTRKLVCAQFKAGIPVSSGFVE
jgi:uncharacterized protein